MSTDPQKTDDDIARYAEDREEQDRRDEARLHDIALYEHDRLHALTEWRPRN